MAEVLKRVDVENVEVNSWKALYSIPTGKTFIVSAINTTSANTIKLRINGQKVISESNQDGMNAAFFKGLILNQNDLVEVQHWFSGAKETITMSGSEIDQA